MPFFKVKFEPAFNDFGNGKLKYTPNGKQKHIGNGKQKCILEGKQKYTIYS